jgi:hypothetical protein
MDERIWTGIHVVQTVAAIFPYLLLERKSKTWSNTESRLDGCKLQQKLLDTKKGPDGNPRRPDG